MSLKDNCNLGVQSCRVNLACRLPVLMANAGYTEYCQELNLMHYFNFALTHK